MRPCAASSHRPASRGPTAPGRGAAFTLIELLCVIGIIAVLAALLLPALSSAKLKAGQIQCASNLKQLACSVHLYAADNGGRLPENLPEPWNTNSWTAGNVRSPVQATNLTLLRQGKLFPYASQPGLFRCPADASRDGKAPRTRSYTMNGWIGSRYMDSLQRNSGFKTFVRDTDLAAAKPARLWLLVEEHEASIDDGWFLVTMDDSRPFASFPAVRHAQGAGVSYADGHAELFRYTDPATARSLQNLGSVPAYNGDWLRLKDLTTCR